MSSGHSMHKLVRDLAHALGCPPNTVRAVLTLQAGKEPTLEVTTLVTDSHGLFVVETDNSLPMARRIARVQFMLRLQPFDARPTTPTEARA